MKTYLDKLDYKVLATHYGRKVREAMGVQPPTVPTEPVFEFENEEQQLATIRGWARRAFRWAQQMAMHDRESGYKQWTTHEQLMLTDHPYAYEQLCAGSITALSLDYGLSVAVKGGNEYDPDQVRHIWIADREQKCCEKRWMTCDDDLNQFIGATVTHIDISDVGGSDEDSPDDSENGCHEVQFCRIHTTQGVLVLCTHNDHNGYYGGFDVTVELEQQRDDK